MKYINKSIVLSLLLVLMLTTISFAGSWVQFSISQENLGTGIGKVSEYYTDEFTTRGNPGIDFWVENGQAYDTITIELQEETYSSGLGWHFETVDTYVHSINSGLVHVIWYTDYFVPSATSRYRITTDAYSVDIDGFVQYYQP